MFDNDQDFSPHLPRLEREFELIRALGSEGTATVYLARQRSSGRLISLDILTAQSDDHVLALQNLERLVPVLAEIAHPNVARVHGVVRLDSQTIALVRQYVTGRSLRELMREEIAISGERVELMVRDIAAGLRALHRLGVVHRDLRPEHIFVDADSGAAMLAGFALARSMRDETRLANWETVFRQPQYMAPELLAGYEIDARADLYSLGLIGWEMLAGRPPWEGENPFTVVYKQTQMSLPDVVTLRDDVPPSLHDAIELALKKERNARWESADAMLAGLPAPTLEAPRQAPVRQPLPPAAEVYAPLILPAHAEQPTPSAAERRSTPRRFSPANVLRIGAPGVGQPERHHDEVKVRRGWGPMRIVTVAGLLLLAAGSFYIVFGGRKEAKAGLSRESSAGALPPDPGMLLTDSGGFQRLPPAPQPMVVPQPLVDTTAILLQQRRARRPVVDTMTRPDTSVQREAVADSVTTDTTVIGDSAFIARRDSIRRDSVRKADSLRRRRRPPTDTGTTMSSRAQRGTSVW
jgi:hypothetical protein